MFWHETVHFLQPRITANPNERGARIAGASEHARMVQAMGARDVAGKSLRPREV
jgi:hypothetical protein